MRLYLGIELSITRRFDIVTLSLITKQNCIFHLVTVATYFSHVLKTSQCLVYPLFKIMLQSVQLVLDFILLLMFVFIVI